MANTLAPVTNFDVTTSWIPVVTPWPSTEACSSQIYSQPGGAFVAFDPLFYSSIDPTALTCLPPAITSWWFQTRLPLFTTSLGPFVCPEAYSTVSASILNSNTAEIFCCPSGYSFVTSCNWATLGQCVMTMTPGQILAYKSEDGAATWVDVTTTIQSSAVTLTAAHVNGFAVSTSSVTSSTGISSSNAATPVPSTSAAATSSTIPNSTANPIAPASETAPSSSKTGLSTAAKVAIGIGIGASVIIGLLTAALVFYWRRASRQKQADGISTPCLPYPIELQEKFIPHELSGVREAKTVDRWELASQE